MCTYWGCSFIDCCYYGTTLGGIDQAFQFIQDTGVVSPGILAVFILGLFWKKTSNKALFGAHYFLFLLQCFLK
jgi:SSS family solute:Na+ symporter